MAFADMCRMFTDLLAGLEYRLTVERRNALQHKCIVSGMFGIPLNSLSDDEQTLLGITSREGYCKGFATVFRWV